MSILPQLWSDDSGQDIAEYAVMLAVILVLVVGTIRLVGSNANNAFSSVASTKNTSRIPPEYLDPETSDRWVAADVLVREEPDEEEDEEEDGEEKEGEEEETRATQKGTTTN